jgi:beta-lactamase class A
MIGRRQWIGAALGAMGSASARAGIGFAALPASFARIEAAYGGRLGVAVLDTHDGRRAGYRQNERFPLASTFKLLAAGAVLARVDAGQDSLERRIRYSAEDLATYSPETGKHVGGEGMTLAALCDAAITLSDNTAGNLLLGVLGGPAGLTAYLRRLGDPMTRLDRTETALNTALPGDPRDTTTPALVLADVQALALGTALSASCRERLRGWMRNNTTGGATLRARLPTGWRVEDKTGSGERGTNNDLGLLCPPNGAAPILVAAYLTGSPAGQPRRQAALAEVGAAVAQAWSA